MPDWVGIIRSDRTIETRSFDTKEEAKTYYDSLRGTLGLYDIRVSPHYAETEDEAIKFIRLYMPK